jgi:ParB/RepB/Spo0J family partition protein
MSASSERKKGSIMPMQLTEIPLETVDLRDRTLVITYAPDLQSLRESIARVGIQQPPILQEIPRSGRYRIVCGYKRLLVLEELGFEKVIAHLVSAEDELKLFLRGLHENLGTRPLNVVEKSLALDKLAGQFRLSREEMLKDHLPALGLGSDPKTLDLYLSLARLEESIKQDLAAGKISIATAQQLLTLSPEDRLAFGELLTALVLGKNLQREFLALLRDLSLKRKTSISELLGDPQITSLVQDPQVQVPIRAKRVRELLIRRRYPRLSRAADEFEEIKKKLRLPAHLSLTASPFFEGQDYRLTITFRSREQLAAAQKALTAMAESSALAELLEITFRDQE